MLKSVHKSNRHYWSFDHGNKIDALDVHIDIEPTCCLFEQSLVIDILHISVAEA
mgnify:CR=1 FL=1